MVANVAQARSHMTGEPGSEEQCRVLEDTVRIYIDQHWGNIHLVGQKTMKSWLNPSTLAFPVLFRREMEGYGRDEKGEDDMGAWWGSV